MAILLDGTMAVEVESAHCLLAWPFAADVSLTTALAAIFSPPVDPAEGEGSGAGLAAGAEPAASAQLPWQPQPWLYLNFLLTNSQLFLPVLDQARRDTFFGDTLVPVLSLIFVCVLLSNISAAAVFTESTRHAPGRVLHERTLLQPCKRKSFCPYGCFQVQLVHQGPIMCCTAL